MNKNEIYMEELNGLVSALVCIVQKQGISLNVVEENKLWDDIQAELEKFFNYPEYRHHL